MYLNYVHNTFRMRRIGAVTNQVWQDTLTAATMLLSKLSRDQVERLLARGYERQFQLDVLARFDATMPAQRTDSKIVVPFSKISADQTAFAA